MKVIKSAFGTVFEINKPNLNGNIFPEIEVMSVVEELKKQVEDNGLLGEYVVSQAEPVTTATLPDYISLNRLSHKITELRIEDGKLKAGVDILDTDAGEELAKTIPLSDVRFAPRILGKPARDGVTVKELKLLSIDLVSGESAVFTDDVVIEGVLPIIEEKPENSEEIENES